jgi:hypothetical protein
MYRERPSLECFASHGLQSLFQYGARRVVSDSIASTRETAGDGQHRYEELAHGDLLLIPREWTGRFGLDYIERSEMTVLVLTMGMAGA